MEGKNTQDIVPLVHLTKDLPVDVRFIEEMPFNGDGHSFSGLTWDYVRILDEINANYPSIQKIEDNAFSTSYNYHIPGHKGNIGVIAAYSRTFCGTCNRIRITPQGSLMTCLYDNGLMNLKDMLREGKSEQEIKEYVLSALHNRAKDGWEAERTTVNTGIHESMASIGG
jgi:molybdenum cofactor biosynthesis enzyme MoaA